MLTFSASEVKRFVHNNKAKRWGQDFYDFMKLDKVKDPQDKHFCDKLYNEPDDAKAKNMVASRTDKTQ